MSLTRALLLSCLIPAGAAAALDLPPTAERIRVEGESHGSLRLPITGWQHGGFQTIWAEGEVTHEAWQMPLGAHTTLQLLSPLREQLAEQGYDIIFECEDRGCGGFDFRYAIEVLPEPDMHVDLGDFRYLAAQRMGTDQPEYVALLVSRSTGRGFIQVTNVGTPVVVPVETVSTRNTGDITAGATAAEPLTLAAASASGDLTDSMATAGRAVLEDLSFETGSARLSEAPFPSLVELAEFLRANPGTEIVLVGHTDAEGSLRGNLALSRARADAVRSRLAERHGIDSARMRAEGVGFLAPLASNLTEEGRTRNCRVEVVVSNPG